ncbi:MAG TPA: energy transducer TonB [Terriglobales bacterium]|nr:energy transducer TonB [Terriglobales bacterium]
MFADSLLHTHPSTARRWTTLISYGAELAAVSVLVIAPLLYTSGLPPMRLASPLLHVPLAGSYEPRPPASGATQPSHTSSLTQFTDTNIHAPGRIPPRIATGPDVEAPPPGAFVGSGSSGIPGAGGVPSSIFGDAAAPPLPAPPRESLGDRIVVSNPEPANALSQPIPQYPRIAVAAHVEGDVILNAVIARDGSIARLHVVSGHPWLAQAALDAVRQWRYRPYFLNGAPVEVETQITVVFRMEH